MRCIIVSPMHTGRFRQMWDRELNGRDALVEAYVGMI